MKGAREKAARGTRMEEFLLPFPVSLAVQLLYTRAFSFSTPERSGSLHQSVQVFYTRASAAEVPMKFLEMSL